MRGDFDDICKCGLKRGNGIHCKECCGWGVTTGVKYHKFVLKKPPKPRARGKDGR